MESTIHNEKFNSIMLCCMLTWENHGVHASLATCMGNTLSQSLSKLKKPVNIYMTNMVYSLNNNLTRLLKFNLMGQSHA